MPTKSRKTNQEWKKILNADQFAIMREGRTETPFTGKYYDHHQAGTYYCAACGNPLFASATKFNSGSGWPSFYQPVAPQNVATKPDNSHNMERTEVICSECESHLGHVFNDGPKPTGMRYCINSAALDFKKEKK